MQDDRGRNHLLTLPCWPILLAHASASKFSTAAHRCHAVDRSSDFHRLHNVGLAKQSGTPGTICCDLHRDRPRTRLGQRHRGLISLGA